MIWLLPVPQPSLPSLSMSEVVGWALVVKLVVIVEVVAIEVFVVVV